MTEKQFRVKVRQLRKDVDKLITEKTGKIIKSGAIDFDDWDDDFILPKAFIAACGNEITSQFRPLTTKGSKEMLNIQKFL
jgi:hypothetical protein